MLSHCEILPYSSTQSLQCIWWHARSPKCPLLSRRGSSVSLGANVSRLQSACAYSSETSSASIACQQQGRHGLQETCRQPAHAKMVACLAAAVVAVAGVAPSPAWAEKKEVRLRDVENPVLQSGLKAATEGRFGEAETLFKVYLNGDPNSASAWSNLGNVHLSTGRAALALEDFDHAISLAPDGVHKAADIATGNSECTINLVPAAPVPYLNRALASEQLGVDAASSERQEEAQQHYKRAVADCQAAIDRDPKEAAAWFNKGNAEMRLGDFNSALTSYTYAADAAPGIAGYRLREAQLLFEEDMLHDSEQLLRTVVRKNPRYVEDQFNMATEIEPSWGDIDFVKSQTRWPPKLYTAMQNLLNLKSTPAKQQQQQ